MDSNHLLLLKDNTRITAILGDSSIMIGFFSLKFLYQYKFYHIFSIFDSIYKKTFNIEKIKM